MPFQVIIIGMKNFFYKVNGKEYEVVVIHKRMKNINVRFKDDKFVVSCPYFTNKLNLVPLLDKYGESLIKRSSKPAPIKDNGMYLFGQFNELTYPGTLHIKDKNLSFKDNDELINKLKPIFKDYVTERVRYYEKLMKVESYKVRVQKMKSRFGSNSKHTKTLNFSMSLIHFDPEVIDSVVVHELAHILVFDHSKKFYDVVYRYCPDYPKYRKMLVKGVYHAESNN